MLYCCLKHDVFATFISPLGETESPLLFVWCWWKPAKFPVLIALVTQVSAQPQGTLQLLLVVQAYEPPVLACSCSDNCYGLLIWVGDWVRLSRKKLCLSSAVIPKPGGTPTLWLLMHSPIIYENYKKAEPPTEVPYTYIVYIMCMYVCVLC